MPSFKWCSPYFWFFEDNSSLSVSASSYGLWHTPIYDVKYIHALVLLCMAIAADVLSSWLYCNFTFSEFFFLLLDRCLCSNKLYINIIVTMLLCTFADICMCHFQAYISAWNKDFVDFHGVVHATKLHTVVSYEVWISVDSHLKHITGTLFFHEFGGRNSDENLQLGSHWNWSLILIEVFMRATCCTLCFSNCTLFKKK